MKKEEKLLELFFNEPTKHWHFEELLKEGKISRPQANIWLKKFRKESLVKRIKEKKKMPYYIAHYEGPNYQIQKRLYALEQLNRTGFLKHLLSLPQAKSIILFGSFSRWDWYKASDIDLFVYGNTDELDIEKYSLKLKRDIQLFSYENKKELQKIHLPLLKNILEGYHIKGSIDCVEVRTHA